MNSGNHHKSVEFPVENLSTWQMNRVLRHRLRNLCAGVKMTVERIAKTTSETHPQIGSRCDIIAAELDSLQNFTSRMDLLFDNLPASEVKTLFDIVSGIRTDFVKKYPLCSIELSGPEENCAFIHGSWLVIALNELLENAGEAAGAEGIINFSWQLNSEAFTFTIANSGKNIPAEIPFEPPEPFNTLRSRHDGIGLSIATRICRAINAEIIIDNSKTNSVVVTIKLPRKELTDE